ncbi:MAG: PAS domain-containing protein [Desulfobacteraceae bacterium]|nr:MAG: PAS domain-containing protein [Desulfobacteraceae bacterium]
MFNMTPGVPSDVSHVSSARGMIVLSRTFGVMSVNAATQELLGNCPAPGNIWPLKRLFGDQALNAAEKNVAEVFRSGRAIERQPSLLQHAGGLLIACQCDFQPLISAKEGIIGLIFTFVPARPGADQEAGAESIQADAEALFADLPQGSFTIDGQWRIRAFNKAAEQITGFSREEALGRHCWEIFRSDSCRTQCPMRQAMDRQLPEMDRQVLSVNRNGLRRTLSVNVSLLKNERGEIDGAVETFHPAGGDRPSPFGAPGRLEGIIGNSPSMRALFTRLPDLAASSANVLICGESGTGKELIARTLHQLSFRPEAPFLAVNCAALPETLIEAELFGYEKGAFTGAEQSRPGRFELAGKGTLLLDEIGELKPELQVKLLRVIEQRSFERVGATRAIAFEARLISATHQDLAKAIQIKRFREDLFYRLRTVTLTVPPLRRRQEDIPLLVDHFIKKFNARTGKCVRALDPKVMQRFVAHRWPGNVRELERCIEHAFVFVKGPVIFQRHLPEFEDFEQPLNTPGPLPPREIDAGKKDTLLWALAQTGGRRTAACKLLGISRTSMWRRMKAMRLT